MGRISLGALSEAIRGAGSLGSAFRNPDIQCQVAHWGTTKGVARMWPSITGVWCIWGIGLLTAWPNSQDARELPFRRHSSDIAPCAKRGREVVRVRMPRLSMGSLPAMHRDLSGVTRHRSLICRQIGRGHGDLSGPANSGRGP
jgi:hypothetical protein